MRILIAALAATVVFCGSAHATVTCNDRICSGTIQKYSNGYKYHEQHRSRIYSHKYATRRITYHARNITSHQTYHGGLTTVCEGGHCGTVAAGAAEKFQGLFRELISLGYNIGSPGCYSPTGHMRNSLHHSGRACDLFNQYARNRTLLRQPPPSVQIEVANHHGLTSGCSWRNADCGHFDLSGYTGRAYAYVPHHRIRYARR